MIGQHIYSRCLEGYFSKSGLNADSTTVTISRNMFVRKEQAQRIARECEKVSTLEDVRPVPDEMQGIYRGVLKIRRLNRQITVVCRSYRLHSDQGQAGVFSGGGESRDFTYGSSYILSGEDKEQFLKHPEYCLNIQDFESYPSVMKRIEESRAQGHNGRIEANEDYSLFKNPCREVNPKVFQQAGFTKEFFVEYISGIIQRVSYSHYEGHEKDKVLVILPKKFNLSWKRCGGNGYAEEVLAATLKILPKCVTAQLSATTGGMQNPETSVLEGYQLIFMEPGPTKEWRRSEYSVIDLDQQECFVTENIDRTYGEFLWDYLYEEEVRQNFEKQYTAVFGEKITADGDNSPEKFALVLQLLQEERNNFADGRKRSRILAELAEYCCENWTERGIELALRGLRTEIGQPGYSRGLEEELLVLIKKEGCPEELQEAITEVIVKDILQGNAGSESIYWVCDNLQEKNQVTENVVRNANKFIVSNKETDWCSHASLIELYFKICGNKEIRTDSIVKREIFTILSDWYLSFLEKNDWQSCVKITQILVEQLADPGLQREVRGEIYQDLIYLLVFGEESSRKQISEILKKEERQFASKPENAELFWSCFRSQVQREDAVVNEDVIWQMTYLAVSQDETFLKKEWEPLYRYFVQTFGYRYTKEVFVTTREYFFNWIKNIRDSEKKQLVCRAIAIAEQDNIEYGQQYYLADMQELRKSMEILEENGMRRAAAELLYKRYLAVADPRQRQMFFLQQLNKKEQWQVILLWAFAKADDPEINTVLSELYNNRKDLLQVVAGFEWKEEREVRATSKIYFLAMQSCIKKKYGNSDSICSWCRLYRNEINDIRQASGKTGFIEGISKSVQELLAKQDPDCIQNLGMEDVVFLKEAGLLPLGENWGTLDRLSEIYTADPHMGSEEFLMIRNRIISETGSFRKQIYLEALETKRKQLTGRNSGRELIYNIVLLEEQMMQEAERDREFSLKRTARRVYEGVGKRELLECALRLLDVIHSYGADLGMGIYDCRYVRKQLIRNVNHLAKMKPELFADKKILQAYRELGNEDKAVMIQGGLDEYLRELPTDWQENYGVREYGSRWDILIPCIFAGVFLLLGIGIELLFFFLYGSIGAKASMVSAIALVVFGVIGDIVVLIWMLVSKSSIKVSANRRN